MASTYLPRTSIQIIRIRCANLSPYTYATNLIDYMPELRIKCIGRIGIEVEYFLWHKVKSMDSVCWHLADHKEFQLDRI